MSEQQTNKAPAADGAAQASPADAAPAAREGKRQDRGQRRERKPLPKTMEELVKVDMPDEDEFKKQEKLLQAGINEAETRIKAITANVDKNDSIRDAARQRKREALNHLKQWSGERESLYSRRKVAAEKIRKIRTEKKTRKDREQELRKSLRFLKVDEIEGAIQRIEYTLSTSTVSLKREKTLIAEIKLLKSQRGMVAEYEKARAAADDPSLNIDALIEERNKANAALDEFKKKEGSHQAQLKKAKEEEKVANNQVKTDIAERRRLVAQSRELKRNLAKLARDYENQKRAHARYVSNLRWIKTQQAREERNKRIAAERKEWEDERKANHVELHPYHAEMDICDELGRYLRGVAPEQAATFDAARAEEKKEEESKAAEQAAARNSAFDGKTAAPLQTSKKAMDAESYGVPATKGKKRKGKKKKKKRVMLTHIPDVFSQFEKLGLKPPLDVDSVVASLESLADKKKYYETAPPPAKKKKAAAAPAEGKRGAAEEGAEAVNPSRMAQLKQEAEDAAEEEKRMRNQNRRASLALLQAEQKRRTEEMAAWEAAAEAESAQARKEAIARAKKMMDDEQARAVKEIEDARIALELERKRNSEAADRASEDERQRRVDEQARERLAAAEESSKAREEGVAKAVQLAEQERDRRISESRSDSTPSLASQSADGGSPSRRGAGGACDHCGKITTIRCSRCKATYFCSRDCQKTAWKAHKPRCVAVPKVAPAPAPAPAALSEEVEI